MTPKEFFTHPTVCPVPWVGVYLHPNGDIRNCSIGKTTLGNINKESIIKIVNDDENHQIRQDMLNNKKNPSCASCWKTESLEKNNILGSSNRSHFKKLLGNSSIKLLDSADNFELHQVDLRWKNTCNLACVYCNSELSSTWAKELNETVNLDEDGITQFKNYVFENIEQLEYVYLCGGEPLLMKENVEFIELIQKKNPDVFIRVNTNLTNIDSPVYKLLSECKNVHWIISVESTEENFNFVRYGANWDKWFNNLQKLKIDADARAHKITFNMVWCSLTAFGVFDAIDQFLKAGFHENSFIIQLLDDPAVLDIKYLKLPIKKELKNIIESRINNVSKEFWLYKTYKLMNNYLDVECEPNTELLKEHIMELDIRRKTNGMQLFEKIL